jgi:hypothetical protein
MLDLRVVGKTRSRLRHLQKQCLFFGFSTNRAKRQTDALGVLPVRFRQRYPFQSLHHAIQKLASSEFVPWNCPAAGAGNTAAAFHGGTPDARNRREHLACATP